jgi:hypothetical protein
MDLANVTSTGLAWPEVLGRLEAARPQARAIWVLADCHRDVSGLARERQATGTDLRRAVEEAGNLVLCTAAGDRSSHESEALRHGLFTQAWLEAIRGTAGPAYDVAYTQSARGRFLDLAGLQFLVNARVMHHARDAGVRQEVQFPPLEGSFSPSQPVFIPSQAGEAGRRGVATGPDARK